MCVCVCLLRGTVWFWLGRVSHCFLLYKSSYSIPHVKYFFQMWPYKSKALRPCGAGRLVSGSCAPCCTRHYLGFILLPRECTVKPQEVCDSVSRSLAPCLPGVIFFPLFCDHLRHSGRDKVTATSSPPGESCAGPGCRRLLPWGRAACRAVLPFPPAQQSLQLCPCDLHHPQARGTRACRW